METLRTVVTAHGRLCALVLLLAIAAIPSAFAGNIIIHRSVIYDDGTKRDADGKRDSTVVWDAGHVHVVENLLSIPSGFTLKIQSGAIVKFAGTIVSDTNDNIISWQQASGGGLAATNANFGNEAGVLIIDGATLTDIRDDTEGGDTNGDGPASSPSGGLIGIAFGGTTADVLQNSKIKYVYKIGRFGSVTVSKNHFINFGSIQYTSGFPLSTDPVPLGATPIIADNIFDFAANGYIDMRGLSAVVHGNTFNSVNQDNVVVIGLRHQYVGTSDVWPIVPQGGSTDVSDNEFLGTGGVQVAADGYDSLFLKQRFVANITHNHFHHDNGDGYVCLWLLPDPQITVTGNVEDNYKEPFILGYDRGDLGLATTSGLQIHNNRFSRVPGSAQVNWPDTMWHRGILIHAENNYWGDPSGPLDYSIADGVSNPRGLCVQLGDGIQYIPFVGGTTSAPPDVVFIDANAPKVPLVPNAATTVSITVERLKLSSAPTGKLYAIIRDATGTQINMPETIVSITSQSSSASIPVIAITVPELTTSVSVELALVPDGDGETMRSNTITFPVAQPPNAFTFLGIYDPTTGYPVTPLVIPGATIRGRAEFKYTHATGPVTFDITIQERDRTGTVLGTITHDVFTVPAGTDLDASRDFSLTIPIRDVIQFPVRNLYGIFVATDGSGNRVGGTEGGYPILVSASSMNINTCLAYAGTSGNEVPTGRGYFITGDPIGYGVGAKYFVGSPDVNNWQIATHATAYDASGNEVQDYPGQGPAESGLASTKSSVKWTHVLLSRPTTPLIPDNARKMRVRMFLATPGGDIMAIDSLDLPVRPKPAQEVGAMMQTGASNLAFAPVPVSLSVTSNSEATGFTTQEFHGQFTGTAKQRAQSGTQSFGPNDYWALTPLNRWYGVFDTVKSSSLQATINIGYDPTSDYPSGVTIDEDSLVMCGYNYFSRALEVLATTVNKSTHTVSTPFSNFFDTYVVASRATKLMNDVRSDLVPHEAVSQLGQLYPNPSTGDAILPITLPRRMLIAIDVYNILGARILSVAPRRYDVGKSAITLRELNLPGGVYTCVVRGEQFRAAERIVVNN